jgi:hypothetical protein
MSVTSTQSFAKALSRSLAITAFAAASALVVPSAHAAIVTGTISGTWGLGSYGFNPGDAFIATYSYDDATIVPFDFSTSDSKYVGYSTSLLSLVVETGSFIQTFLPNARNYASEIYFTDLEESSYRRKYWKISASSYSDSSFAFINNFSAYKLTGEGGDMPFEIVSVTSYQFNTDTLTIPYMGKTYSGDDIYSYVTFNPDPTATTVPTPALLPGLVGMGIAALRRRKQAVTVSEDV